MGKDYVLITAGGTSVPIDGVRKITNSAKGALGVALAKAYSSLGWEVKLFCTEMTSARYDVSPGVEVIHYDTFDEYVSGLQKIVDTHGQPSIALSTAAVSDFGVDRHPGKMHVLQTLTFHPLPKVLSTWREQFGRNCYIVGFKLLDPETETFDDLLSAARSQNERAHLDLTVANFKPWGTNKKNDGKRDLYLVKPDGSHIPLSGSLSEISERLVDFTIVHLNRSEEVNQSLSQKVCGPCNKLTPRLTEERIAELLFEVSSWKCSSQGSLFREWKFPDFALALAFVNKVAVLAEQENHHPDISFGWGFVKLELSTYAIKGLSENDFILAAKINEIA